MKAIVIAFKDLRSASRNLFALGMMLVAPLLLASLLYLAFGAGGATAPAVAPAALTLIVVDRDRAVAEQPALGRLLVDSFRHPAVRAWLSLREAGSEAEARAALAREPGALGLLIPEGLSRAVLEKGDPPALRLIEPAGSHSSSQRALESWLQLALDSLTAAQLLDAAPPPASSWLELRPPSTGARPASAGSSRVLAEVTTGLLIFFIFFSAGQCAQSISLEAQGGTLGRMLTTPTAAGVILAGKFLSVFAIVAVQVTILLSLSSLLLGIHWGRAPGVVLVAFAVVVAAGGFGVLLVSLAQNSSHSGIIVSTISAAAGMLGGLFTSAVRMPAAFEVSSWLVPQGWAMRGFTLLLGGAGVPQLLWPSSMLCLIGALSLLLGVVRFRRHFA